jgi:antitoxin HicB
VASPFRYRIVVEWNDQDDAYLAFVPALPGCTASGTSVGDAALAAQQEAEEQLELLTARGQPAPAEELTDGYSGDLELHLPRSLHGHLERLAAVEGVSLDQVVTGLLVRQPGLLAPTAAAPASPPAARRPRRSPTVKPRRSTTARRSLPGGKVTAPAPRRGSSSRGRAALTWVTKQRGKGTLVLFDGDVDERVDFRALHSLTGAVTFDLAGVHRFNSEGVRAWIEFITGLKRVTSLAFVRCSIAVIQQLNLFHGIKGKAEIRSFYAPYVCAESGEEELRLLTTEEIKDPLNPPSYRGDSGEMELDETPERYLAFLMDR